MTNEEIRIAIAESLGWSHYHLDLWVPPEQTGNPDDFSELQCTELPNYPEDLNACHEMENGLSDEEHKIFTAWLVKLFGSKTRSVVSVEAPQRCEAYLKVKGLLKP